MKVISMMLKDTEIARISEGEFETLIELKGPVPPKLYDWYNACFFGIAAPSKTFDERFDLVEKNNYFCYMKPQLKLIAKIIP